MKYGLALVGIGTLIIAGLGAFSYANAKPEAAAQYTASGELIYPENYREWVFLTSGVNMTYGAPVTGMGHDMVDNVFVDPQSWQEFKQTGKWRDGTGTPRTGTIVLAASIPGRWAAPPAPAMIARNPRPAAASA